MINAHSLCHLEPLQNAALKFTKVQNVAVNYSSAWLVPLAAQPEPEARVDEIRCPSHTNLKKHTKKPIFQRDGPTCVEGHPLLTDILAG